MPWWAVVLIVWLLLLILAVAMGWRFAGKRGRR
jgi:hypothetical protein